MTELGEGNHEIAEPRLGPAEWSLPGGVGGVIPLDEIYECNAQVCASWVEISGASVFKV